VPVRSRHLRGLTMYRTHWFSIFIIIITRSSRSVEVAAEWPVHRHVEARQQMDWWGLPDAVATAGKLFEYRLDRLTDDGDDNDDDYGSAAGDQPRQLTLDVYQVSSSSSSSSSSSLTSSHSCCFCGPCSSCLNC